MCEIQLIKRIGKELDDTDRGEFLRLMAKGSVTNNDAFGVFCEGITHKKGDKFEKPGKSEFRRLVLEQPASFFVGHNRLKTQGDASNNDNNHPFEDDNWKVVHNGMITNDTFLKGLYKLNYKEETDSAIILALLGHFTKEGDKPLTAVKKTAERLYGSFSVVCYNKTNNNIYYFKDATTSFSFGLINDDRGKVIIGTTNRDSLKECYTDKEMGIFPKANFKTKSMVTAEGEKIYIIDDNKIYVAKDFEEADYNSKYYSYRQSSFGTSNSIDDVTYDDMAKNLSGIKDLFGEKNTNLHPQATIERDTDDFAEKVNACKYVELEEMYPRFSEGLFAVKDDVIGLCNIKYDQIWFDYEQEHMEISGIPEGSKIHETLLFYYPEGILNDSTYYITIDEIMELYYTNKI